ncbi:BMP family ABC transporter substrate-binding protein [Clostridium sp. C8-1-8]|uniref:BMP family ABC transporter substrate-binding protein n=1 Tax=Clostridium sp. C8-1-8 TaxID=2698831 RepID=UPI00136FC211|nr:BMP family ABC transporter substrate-binding protein [Clostridium sp. C8-1-8]
MKKKIFNSIIVMIVISSMLAACSSKKEASSKEGSSKSKTKISLIVDEAGTKDRSFNQAVYEGVDKAAKQFGISTTTLESKSKDDFQKNIDSAAKESDLTFGVGYLMVDAITRAAKNKSDKNFVIIDALVDVPNVKSVTFNNEEGAFLMGIIAGKMSKTNKVGFIGGAETPISESFEVGFACGVKAVNPSAFEAIISKKNVRYVGTFTDKDKAYSLAKELYDRDCDIIFHAAGTAGEGVFKAAKESKKWAIGNDVDQGDLYEKYTDVILSSMVKNLDKVSYQACKESIEGKFRGGENNVVKLGLSGEGIEIAKSTSNNTPKDIISLAEKYKSEIVSGKFKVPTRVEEAREFTPPNIE